MYNVGIDPCSFQLSPWQSPSQANAGTNQTMNSADLIFKPPQSTLHSSSQADVNGAKWEGGKEQSSHHVTSYVPQNNPPDPPACKGTLQSRAALIQQQAEEHRPSSQGKWTSVCTQTCAGRLKGEEAVAAGTTSKMNYIHSYLLGTMRAENHLAAYYHNSFHTSQPEWSVGYRGGRTNNRHKVQINRKIPSPENVYSNFYNQPVKRKRQCVTIFWILRCFSQFTMAPNVPAKAVIPGRLSEAESKACGICRLTGRESFTQVQRTAE